jgi:predicted ArsR family transcriptional regulator
MLTETQNTTQQLIDDTQIRMFIISNHASKSITDMAKDLGVVHQQVTAKYKVLIKENVISREDSLPKGIVIKTPRVKKEPIKKHKSKTILEAIDETNRQLVKLNKNIESAEKLKIDELGNYTGGGKQKDLARDKMVNYITRTGLEGVVPSLMFTNTYIEETILKTLPNMEFIGIDDNPKVVSQLKKNIRAKKLPITTKVGKISEMIYGIDTDTYGHLILDYCGNLFTFTKEIEHAIDNDIVKVGGIIAITFSKTMRSGNGQNADFIRSLSSTISNNVDDFRCDADRQNESYFYNIIGRKYAVREFFHYHDSSPMSLVIIQRVK